MSSFRFLCLFVVACLSLFSNAVAAQEDFASWLEALRQEAKATGISDKTSTDTIKHVEFLPDVVVLDHAQPEFISPFLDYYLKRVDKKKIQKGQALLIEHEEMLNRIQTQYGVPKSVLVAFWGMETQYGSYQGNIDTLSTLATLAYEGRRAAFFRAQLLDAMRMIEAGHAHVDSFRGSWAGAFGNMQFMPTTFMAYAVDGDEDGKIDIVNSLPDAFASAANYLSRVGWHADEPAMIEVQLPIGFDWQSAQLTLKKPAEEWAQLGVSVISTDSQIAQPVMSKVLNPKNKKAHDRPVSKKAMTQQAAAQSQQNNNSSNSTSVNLNATLPVVNGQAAILLPQGWRGPAFMVFDNFYVIMDWNRSVNYALSVAQLAKRLKQEPRIIGGQFAEEGALTFQQMMELQGLLNARGFDAGVPDGFPGLQTQAAVRSYQLSQQLPADGYASPSIYQKLLSQP